MSRKPHSTKRRTLLHLIPIVLVAAIAGYALAITLAKSGAPKQTVYDLPHDFRVTDPTFLPSALPGSTLTTGNRVEILENGVGIFPPMLEAIAAAKKTVDFEAYIFWSGNVASRFRDAFVERASHGVAVRILLDAVGSPGRKLKSADVEALKRAGCRVEFFHSREPWKVWVLNHRTHRRILVVDGAVGFTGGVGFADEWSGDADSPEHWRETQVRVAGPAVRGLQRAFQDNWSEVTGEALVGPEFFPRFRRRARCRRPSCRPRRSRRCPERAGSTRFRSPPPRRRSGSRIPTFFRTSTVGLFVAAVTGEWTSGSSSPPKSTTTCRRRKRRAAPSSGLSSREA